MNNINMQEIGKFVALIENDASAAKKTKSVKGSWVFEEGKPQFVSKLGYPNGEIVLNSELPNFAGGWGNSPDPIQYCLYGLAACFAATFAANAAGEGIELKKLEVTAENSIDMRKMLGLSDENIIQKIKFVVDAEGPSGDQLEKLLALARERCPGVECITRQVPLDAELKK